MELTNSQLKKLRQLVTSTKKALRECTELYADMVCCEKITDSQIKIKTTVNAPVNIVFHVIVNGDYTKYSYDIDLRVTDLSSYSNISKVMYLAMASQDSLQMRRGSIWE